MSMNTMLLGTVAICEGEWIGQWADGAGWFGEGLCTAYYKKCKTGTEHCVNVTCNVMFKTPNVIQIYLLLCSAVLQGAFKFRSCVHITVGIKF